MALTTTWYILPEIDQLCFHCPIPLQCRESDPRCLYHLARAAGNVERRKPARREVQVLNYLAQHPNTYFRGKDLANAISASYQTTLNLLRRLKAKDEIRHVGEGHTSRWSAKDTPQNK